MARQPQGASQLDGAALRHLVDQVGDDGPCPGVGGVERPQQLLVGSAGGVGIGGGPGWAGSPPMGALLPAAGGRYTTVGVELVKPSKGRIQRRAGACKDRSGLSPGAPLRRVLCPVATGVGGGG
jgi:hypothetical protein